jgi:4-hydroxythreonine-4-phosphate dehydrogenase
MLFGITMGDASGVGAEIVLRTHAAGRLRWPCVVYGDRAVLETYNRNLGCGVRFGDGPGELPVRDHGLLQAAEVTPGRLSPAAGRAAREYVVSATRAALRGEIDALVTLPMNKEATQKSDPAFTGHTELIAALCGVSGVTIMLVSESLIVTHVSTHVSLREAIELAKRDRIVRIVELTCGAVSRLRPGQIVAVAGLNPHAGENGLFGREEIEEIIPAVEEARRRGHRVEGPLPPDSLFYLAVRRRMYGAVVCMYHDQGHIPSKLLDFEGGVNVALGLPIVRTSVDHGTAFDIAGQGIASTASFEAALDLAARLAAKSP